MFRFKVLFALILVSALACYADSSAPAVTFNPVKLDFTGVPVGSVSAGVPVILTNSGNAALTINEIKITAGEFSQQNNCPATLLPTQTCIISVSFAPTKGGKTTGTLSVTDNAGGSPQKFPLTGDTVTGMTLTVASDGQGSVTVTAGQTATYKLLLTSIGNFTGNVTFDCVGLPNLTTCSFDPATPNLASSAAVPVTLSMKTTGSTASVHPLRKVEIFLALCGALCFGGVFGFRKTGPRTALLISAVAIILVLGMVACGGGSSTTTPATTTTVGTYTVQATAKSGNTQQGISLTLVVQ
jgi:hypothetical protein